MALTAVSVVTSRIRRGDCRLFESFDALQPYEPEWDRLAVRCGKPTCRPAWLRAWWDAYCAPANRESRALRVVVVTDDQKLIGLFPGFLVDRTSLVPDLRLLGERHFWSVEPLVSSDAPRETLALFARALGESRPPPVRLMTEWTSTQSTWPAELRRGWPGGPAWLRRSQRGRLQVIEGPSSAQAWLAGLRRRRRGDLLPSHQTESRSGLRSSLYRNRGGGPRRCARAGATPSCPPESALPWLTEGLEEAIVEAGRSLISTGDFRLWKTVRGEQVIGAALFARAGDVSELLLTAFDPDSSRLAPGLGAIVAGIRHELDTGVRLIDFGYAGAEYLQVLSNAERPIVRYELFPTNLRMPLARARWLRAHSRERVTIWRDQLQLHTARHDQNRE